MITNDLLSFIKQQFAAGKNKEQIRFELRQMGGWQDAEIEEAFEIVSKKKKGKGFFSVLLILILLGAGAYAAKHYDLLPDISFLPHKNTVSVEQSTPEPTEKTYKHALHNVSFTYPADWNLTEKSYSSGGMYAYTGMEIFLTNPVLPKTAYDCCYTPEEIQKEGIQPKLVVQIIDDVTTDVDIKTFGLKTKELYEKLIAQGYDEHRVRTALGFIPRSGSPGSNGQSTTWQDNCSTIILSKVAEVPVVHFSGCPDGMAENTGAVFIRNDGPHIVLHDSASEYAKRGDFKKILDSFIFHPPSEQLLSVKEAEMLVKEQWKDWVAQVPKDCEIGAEVCPHLSVSVVNAKNQRTGMIQTMMIFADIVGFADDSYAGSRRQAPVSLINGIWTVSSRTSEYTLCRAMEPYPKGSICP